MTFISLVMATPLMHASVASRARDAPDRGPRLCLLEGVSEDLAPLRETRSCHFRQEMASQGEVHFTVNLRVRARREEVGKEERIEESSKRRSKREVNGDKEQSKSNDGDADENFSEANVVAPSLPCDLRRVN